MIRQIKNVTAFLLIIAITAAADPIAVITRMQGSGTLLRGQSGNRQVLEIGVVLDAGDRLETAADGFCTLVFVDDKSTIRIYENSAAVLGGERREAAIHKTINIAYGTFWISLPPQHSFFRAATPTSRATAKGTEFWVLQPRSGATRYIGLQGLIDLESGSGKVLLRAGQTAVVDEKEALPEIRLTAPEDIPLLQRSPGQIHVLEIEFKDENGKSRLLRVEYLETP
ncbi:MAG: FecR domain-containing protein [Calditrichia bacterium]